MHLIVYFNKGIAAKEMITPRRSARLQTKKNDKTPDQSSAPRRGPRAMLKMYKNKQNISLNLTQESNVDEQNVNLEIPKIIVTAPSLQGNEIEKDLKQVN